MIFKKSGRSSWGHRIVLLGKTFNSHCACEQASWACSDGGKNRGKACMDAWESRMPPLRTPQTNLLVNCQILTNQHAPEVKSNVKNNTCELVQKLENPFPLRFVSRCRCFVPFLPSDHAREACLQATLYLSPPRCINGYCQQNAGG